MRKSILLTLLLSTGALLGGCGGGSSDKGSAAPAVSSSSADSSTSSASSASSMSTSSSTSAASSSAASASSSSSVPAIPSGTISGTAVDAFVVGGTVTAYDFTGGTKGASLASTTTDARGGYTLTLQVTSRPVLIELNGGNYIEDATKTKVDLASGKVLRALVSYSAGQSHSTSITLWTNIATALASLDAAKGTAVDTAISAASDRVSKIVGVDIVKVTPADVTDSASQSTTLTPALRYGWLSAAVSTLTSTLPLPSGEVVHTKDFTSVSLAQTMYDDVIADGLLDGKGAGGTQLKFGSSNLGVDTYRYALAVAILKFADNTNNATKLKTKDVASFANDYATSSDAVWNALAPKPLSDLAVAFVSPTPDENAYISGSVSLAAHASDILGIASVKINVDSEVLGSQANSVDSPVATWDTSTFAEGIHRVTATATNSLNASQNVTRVLYVDRTAPTVNFSTNTYIGNSNSAPWSCVVTGTASDASNQISVSASYTGTYGTDLVTTAGTFTNGNWSVTLTWNQSGGADLDHPDATITFTDSAGNQSTKTITRSTYTVVSNPVTIYGAKCTVK